MFPSKHMHTRILTVFFFFTTSSDDAFLNFNVNTKIKIKIFKQFPVFEQGVVNEKSFLFILITPVFTMEEVGLLGLILSRVVMFEGISLFFFFPFPLPAPLLHPL